MNFHVLIRVRRRWSATPGILDGRLVVEANRRIHKAPKFQPRRHSLLATLSFLAATYETADSQMTL